MEILDELKEEILDSLGDAVFFLDEDFKVLWCNERAEQILGISRNVAIGRHCSEVLKLSICHDACPVRSGVDPMEGVIDYKGVSVGSDSLAYAVRFAPFRSGQRNLSGWIVTIRDVRESDHPHAETVEIPHGHEFHGIVSKNPKIERIFEILPDVSRTQAPVLIEGESGTGKELFANAIHKLSLRSTGPFIKINCSAFPETLLESELFGYVRGAFTDAKRDKPGMFQLAHGGTLFLDEIGDISPALQVKLLRAVQDGEFIPLGGTRATKVDVRIISATNRNLEELVSKELFRRDLYYRLNVVRIHIPPLRERSEDIPILVRHLIERFRKKTGRPIEGISWDAMEVLQHYDFPGNVRELENIIEHAFIMCKERTIKRHHLPSYLFGLEEEIALMEGGSHTIQDLESRTILDALRRHGGNKMKAAKELGIHRTTLWRKLKRMGIDAT